MSYDEFDDSKKGLSIASMVLGIISIVLSCTGVGIVTGIIALILGGISLYKKQGIKGMAITGVVLSIISLAFWALLLALGFGSLAALGPAIGAM